MVRATVTGALCCEDWELLGPFPEGGAKRGAGVVTQGLSLRFARGDTGRFGGMYVGETGERRGVF